MKHFTPGIRLTIFLLLTCALLGAVLALQWRTPTGSASGTITRPTGTTTSNTEPTIVAYTPPAIAAFGEILERPLFSPDRQPPPEPEPAAAPVVTTPLRLHLEGVAINTEARVAVVRDLSNNELIRIVEGDKHQGWMVERVHPAGAIFSRGNETRELTLVPDEKLPNKR